MYIYLYVFLLFFLLFLVIIYLLCVAFFRVPNIKFNVAKVLQSLIPIVDHSVSFFLHKFGPIVRGQNGQQKSDRDDLCNLQVVESTIKPCLVDLSEDPDVDVRYFANQAIQALNHDMMSS